MLGRDTRGRRPNALTAPPSRVLVLTEPPRCKARERRRARADGLRSLNALARIVRTSTDKEAVVAIAMLLDFGTPPGSAGTFVIL